MAGSQEQLEATSVVKILEALAAFALVAGILIAMADTRLYPLAFGIVVIAGFYYLLSNPSVAHQFGSLVNRAGQVASGQSAPNP